MRLRIGNKRIDFSFALLVFSIFYFVFSILDLAASVQTGHKGADRSIAHVAILLVTVFLFVYFIINININKATNISLIYILAAMLFWTSAVNIFNGVSTWNLLVQENMSLLWILSCFFFEKVRLQCNSNKPIRTFAVIFFIFYICATVYYFFDMYIKFNRIPVLNVVYCVIALLPWVIVDTQNQKNDLFLFAVAIAVCLLSMKRGAIIAIILMILTYYFIQAFIKKNYNNFIKLLFFTILLIIAFAVADKLSGGFLSQRFSEEEMSSGSGRMEQFTAVINALKESKAYNLLFGHGMQKSLDIFGTGIHNEWLGFFFNYGIIGLILYAMMVFSFFRQSIIISRNNKNLSVPCFMMSVFYFVLSMVSTGYGGYVGTLLFGFWGYINAENKIGLTKEQRRI